MADLADFELGSGDLSTMLTGSARPCGDEVSSLVQSVRDHARTMRRLAVVEAELKAARVDATALRAAIIEYADSRGVNVGDDDDDWWKGYRNAQRVALHDAQEFKRHALADPEGGN